MYRHKICPLLKLLNVFQRLLKCVFYMLISVSDTTQYSFIVFQQKLLPNGLNISYLISSYTCSFYYFTNQIFYEKQVKYSSDRTYHIRTGISKLGTNVLAPTPWRQCHVHLQ